MSGINHDALEELCSERNYSEHPPHMTNILKFAVLRKDHSFMAIGGKWQAEVDGGDPYTEDSSLIQTAKRYDVMFSSMTFK